MDIAYSNYYARDLTDQIIGSAISVHRELGPGLLETVYRKCLLREFEARGIPAQSEVPIPIRYKDTLLDCGFRADIVVNDKIILELKAIDRILPVHEAQLLTYLKLCNLRVGLISIPPAFATASSG